MNKCNAELWFYYFSSYYRVNPSPEPQTLTPNLNPNPNPNLNPGFRKNSIQDTFGYTHILSKDVGLPL